MKACCHNNCNQGRTCTARTSEHSIISPILSYVICSIAAVALVALIAAVQTMDARDEQKVRAQVMACSEFPVECRAFAEMHAIAPANSRQWAAASAFSMRFGRRC